MQGGAVWGDDAGAGRHSRQAVRLPCSHVCAAGCSCHIGHHPPNASLAHQLAPQACSPLCRTHMYPWLARQTHPETHTITRLHACAWQQALVVRVLTIKWAAQMCRLSLDGRLLGRADSQPLHSVAAYGALPQRNPSYKSMGRAARMAVAALASCTLADQDCAGAFPDPLAIL